MYRNDIEKNGSPPAPNADHYRIGEWTFTPEAKQLVNQAGKIHTLEDKASDLLTLLCARRGHIVSREEIIQTVWQGRSLSEQTVPVAISKIRKALGEGGTDSVWLQTIPKRGYKLAEEPEETQANEIISTPSPSLSRLTLLGGFSLFLIFLVFFWPKATPFIPPAGAGKPGIILTVKDIRTSLESEQETGKVIALSELASFYLSQISEVLVIRHWWNIDAPDPTGGIFTRYGEDTPVYLLTGTLIEDAGAQLVTLFLSNPKTDEVIWSGIHQVAEGSANYFNTLADMFETIGIMGTPQKRRSSISVPSDDQRYWTARYMGQLSDERSAAYAATILEEILAEKPTDIAALQAVKALASRWPVIPLHNGPTPASSEAANNHLSLADQASIAFYSEKDIDRAMDLINQALTIAPGDHYSLSVKAEILLEKGELKEAIATYRKAIKLAPFASAYEDRVTDLVSSGL